MGINCPSNVISNTIAGIPESRLTNFSPGLKLNL